MNRYQTYLDPQSVATVDDVARFLDVSRSQIIRDVVDRVALEYKKLFTARIHNRSDNSLLKMAGVIKGVLPGISENVDEIYLQD